MNCELSYTDCIRPAFDRRSLLDGIDILGLLWIGVNQEYSFMKAEDYVCMLIQAA